MDSRMIEIEQRLGEIDKEKRNFATEISDPEKVTEERTNEINKKLDDINSEKEKLEAEKRTLQTNNETVKLKEREERIGEKKMEVTLNKQELREAFAKEVLNRCSYAKRHFELSDVEKRALGVATTTTATEYVAPSAEADGVNNAGLFIPTQISLDILNEIELQSPFLSDVNITNIPGLITFPYVKTAGTANNAAENTTIPQESNEYAMLDLKLGNIKKLVVVTLETLALTVPEFANFLISEMTKAVREELATEAFYGTGTNRQIKGVTVDAINAVSGGYEGSVIDAIAAGIALLPKRKRAGAKIYISDSAENEIVFKKDLNGNYIFPIFNGAALQKIGALTVSVDPFLHDGDFLIGNAQNYKLNATKNINLYPPTLNSEKGTLEYLCHAMFAGAPVPNAFVYGQKKSV